ncbi:MAG: hypothetical protein EAZ07_06145 [Cytophagales bacterium]|nr:MAG: hypothetical protein EAZ07_06145 [Cytophagales bacterium]
MNLKEIAAVAGKSGLFKVLKPTRNGVILEAIDEQKAKIIANNSTRVSILSEISMYTTGAEPSKSLEEIFKSIFAKYKFEIPVNPKSDGGDLNAFLESVLPDYDKERVYTSDIKKLVTWYGILAQVLPEMFKNKEEVKAVNTEDQSGSKEKDIVEAEKKPKAKKTTKKVENKE